MTETTTTALVLHGAKDLRLVNPHHTTNTLYIQANSPRNNAQSPPQQTQKSKSPSAQPASAAQTSTTTATAAMATSSSAAQCVSATNLPA